MFKRPGNDLQHVATPDNVTTIALLGADLRFEGVAFTRDQHLALSKFYGLDPVKAESKAGGRQVAGKSLIQAGDDRNLLREARTDGLRLMAFLSKHLAKDEDPVKFVHDLCRAAGFDVGMAGFDEESDAV